MDDPVTGLRAGMRVVVRHRLDRYAAGAVGARLTDVVGELLTVTPEHLQVRTRRGTVLVERRAVVAAKEVPPRPSRRGAPHRAVGVGDLQRVMVAGWPPQERSWLGGWLLRAAGGYTGRANSALPLGDPGIPLPEAVAALEQWYRDRGLPPKVTVPGPEGFTPQQDAVGAELLGRGYRLSPRVIVLTAAVATISRPAVPAGFALLVQERLTKEWLAASLAARPRPGEDPDAARAVLTGSPEQLFLSLQERTTDQSEGPEETAGRAEPVATARVAVAQSWSGVFALHVATRHRRQGLATAVMGAAANEAEARGIRSMYVQVQADNVEALGLYRGLGFATHHEYVYLVG